MAQTISTNHRARYGSIEVAMEPNTEENFFSKIFESKMPLQFHLKIICKLIVYTM